MSAPIAIFLFRSDEIENKLKLRNEVTEEIHDFFRHLPSSEEGMREGILTVDTSCYDIEYASFFSTRHPYVTKDEARYFFKVIVTFDDGILGKYDADGYSEYEILYKFIPDLIFRLRPFGLIQSILTGPAGPLIEYHRSIDELIRLKATREFPDSEMIELRIRIQSEIDVFDGRTDFEKGEVLLNYAGPSDSPPAFHSLL
ncbi:MAG: hypothetical protein ACXADB_14260 [Candidatus Hermodarchaeia archaeon]|jgi:hypothetical protein